MYIFPSYQCLLCPPIRNQLSGSGCLENTLKNSKALPLWKVRQDQVTMHAGGKRPEEPLEGPSLPLSQFYGQWYPDSSAVPASPLNNRCILNILNVSIQMHNKHFKVLMPQQSSYYLPKLSFFLMWSSQSNQNSSAPRAKRLEIVLALFPPHSSI